MRVSIVLALAFLAPESDRKGDVGLPRTGQPAAEVLGSADAWGNPTFIGGLTNAGPTSHSVW